MRWGIVLLGAAGCAGSGGPGCEPGADPTLEIGSGIGGYTAVPDGGEMPLVHGPQGGWHLEIGLFATHIAADDLLSADLEGVLDGEVVATNTPWADFRCDASGEGVASWGSRLIYGTATAEELDGQITTITAAVTDLRGTTVVAQRDFRIRDRP